MATETVKSRAESIEDWAREHSDDFLAGTVATYLNVPANQVGPTLSAMVRTGVLRSTKKGGKTVYRLAEELQSDVTDLADPDFVPSLMDELAEHLATLNRELVSIDARRKDIDTEASRVRSALKVLS